ncbi:MAG: threonylcarbamoyl-AMP synthase [archaeon]|nr:threonylcarbamoyl-AMP synthase [archaeon]
MRILKCNIDPDEHTSRNIICAADDIADGKLVVYPTETVYGIAADIFNQKAIKNLYVAKNRPFDMPLSVAVADKNMIKDIAIVPRSIEKLIDAFLPGPLTIIVKKSSNVPDIVTSMSQEIGIRIPDNRIAIELIRQFGGPITATSANIHSHPDTTNINTAVQSFGDLISTYLDCGTSMLGKPSTIVGIVNDKVEIIRQGTISQEQIEAVLNA